MKRILIADDSKQICDSLGQTLAKEGYDVDSVNTPPDCLQKALDWQPDVILVDIFFGKDKAEGVELVKDLSVQNPTTPCISISGESDIYKILECLQNGAFDFIEKPISLPRLLTSVKNALKVVSAKQFSQDKASILGQSQAIKDVLFRIKKVAPLTESVLIRGESGTGKELVAENLHLQSNRFDKPFYRLNCAALSSELIESELFGHKKGSFTGADTDKKGYFELANGGSLFLDEVGDLPEQLQSKLLRVLQEGKVTPVGDSEEISINTRVICATHQHLEDMIKEGRFREDLFFRISTFTIQIPALRDRFSDIDILAPAFLQDFLDQNNLGYKSFSDNAIAHLKSYHYPGNIRELAMIVKNAALFTDGDTIEAESIMFQSISHESSLLDQSNDMTFAQAKSFLEKSFLEHRLRVHQNNVDDMAKSLGLIKTNLYRKLRECGVTWK